MFVYLDANAYIAAKYRFDKDAFGKLRQLIENGSVEVLYTSATIGEVLQHIENDVAKGITDINRIVRKEIPALAEIKELGIRELQSQEAIESVKKKLNDFLASSGVIRISLNPLDAEKLISDYLEKVPPFELQKPNEFKDAIVINAIRNYQKTIGAPILIVSSDQGFRKAFGQDESISTVEYLSGALREHYKLKQQKEIEQCIVDALAEGLFDDTLRQYFMDLDIDRGYYSDWECDEKEIDDLDCELLYMEQDDGKVIAHLSVELYITATITHRDEDTSFYDKEEDRYLIQNYVTWNEQHCLSVNADVLCNIEADEEPHITPVSVIDNRQFNTLDLDEGTLQDWDEVNSDVHEEPDLIYCSECGKLLGHHADYCDYDDNPLCSDCMTINEHGDICPSCGRKVPHELMNSGFCIDCFQERN